MSWIGDLTDILDKSAFSSSKYHTGAYAYKPYLAFDNHNSTTTHDGFQIHYADGNDWLKIDFNKKVHPSKIKMQANTNYNLPKIIDISMSIDDIVYDYIDTININVTDTDIHEFIFKQPKKNYRFVKFNFPEKTEWIEINRIELYQTNSLNIIKDTNLNYFSINSDFYNKNLKAYIPLNSFSSSNINELITETGFMLENINNIIQLDDETFKPINKFKDFKICTKR